MKTITAFELADIVQQRAKDELYHENYLDILQDVSEELSISMPRFFVQDITGCANFIKSIDLYDSDRFSKLLEKYNKLKHIHLDRRAARSNKKCG